MTVLTPRAVDIRQFGALGNGSHDDTTALLNALDVERNLYFPTGTYLLSDIELPDYAHIFGDGWGRTILKAPDGQGATYLLKPNLADDVFLHDFTIDGNRANGGMFDGLSAMILLGGNRATLERLEVRNGTRIGLFVGHDSAAADSNSIERCWIHDNGGVVNDSGYGVGIGSGGVTTPTNLSIARCLIEHNYNTVTKPGDSTAMNLVVNGVHIDRNVCRDNFNVNGGQFAIWGDPDQTHEINAMISFNRILQTTTFGTPTDRSGGIEIQGRKFTCIGNIIKTLGGTAFGIAVGGDATHAAGKGTIIGNTIEIPSDGAGIHLDAAGVDSPITELTIVGNEVIGAAVGIETNAANTKISLGFNNFSACTQAQGGAINISEFNFLDNQPFTVANEANGRRHTAAISVASAGNQTLGFGNANEITGTNTINRIDGTGWVNGDEVTLYFPDSLTVKHAQGNSGAFYQILMLAGADWTTSKPLKLLFNGSAWLQV